MEAAACLGLLKSACGCLVSQAKSTAAEEIALLEGVDRDAKFLSEELEEMHRFLVDVEKYEAEEVVEEPSDGVEAPRWVGKIRDMACDIEDCLLDLAPHAERPSSWWRYRWASLAPRHSVAAELKELVSRVTAMPERRKRYQLASRGAAKKLAVGPADEEARHVVPDIDWRVDLGQQLLARTDEQLVVLSVWLMKDPAAADGGRAISLVGEVYDNPSIHGSGFQCRAWVTATHPLSLTDFVRGLARQLLAPLQESQSALNVLGSTEAMGTEQLMAVVAQHLGEKRYLVVVEGVCTRSDWDWIKLLFPDNRNSSRIIATSQRADVARHCAGRPSRSFTLEEVPNDGARVYTSSEQGVTKNEVIKIETYRQFVGREIEVQQLTRKISEIQWTREISESDPVRCVIAVCGDNGIGKSTLVRNVVYESPELRWMFQRRAWVTMVLPFNPEGFLRAIILQFKACSSPGWGEQQSKSGISFRSGGIHNKSLDELRHEISELMEGGRSLVTVDGLSTKEEWDRVKSCLWNDGNRNASCTVIVTTTKAAVADHCSGRRYKLSSLDSAAARQLFYQKVFKSVGLVELSQAMVDQANRMLDICDGNPLAINIISGLLATKTRTSIEWKRLLDRFDSKLKNNPDVVGTAAELSYEDLPSNMKSLFLYLSIFPRSYNVMRRRLAGGWIAEGQRRNARGKDAEEVEEIFDGLVTRSMIQPSKRADITGGRINGCRVHDVFLQLGISERKSENFLYILDEHTNSTVSTISQMRHLVVTSGWRRLEDEFKSMNLSLVRSLTIFGEWRSCFISPRMKLLRVLDLEDTKGLVEHDLEQIGEFRHLKYLGLRNTGIAHLPNSLGKLQGLEVLDIRCTYVAKLPSTAVHLTRLCHLRGGTMTASMESTSRQDFIGEVTRDCPRPLQNAAASAFCMLLLSHILACHSQARTANFPQVTTAVMLALLFKRYNPYGVRVPRKIGALKSLQTLGTIDVAGSRRVIKELQKLTQLQRLGVIGVTKQNSKLLCSTVEHLHHLRSLMVHSEDSLSTLHSVSSPPGHLQMLKLYGSLGGTLPRWIKTLHNLLKLCLCTTLLDGDAIQIIAKLPKLTILRLLAKSFVVEEMAFQSDAFPKLELLQFAQLENLTSVSFEGGAAPNLETLQVDNCNFLKEDDLSGLHDLPRIKKVLLDGVLVPARSALARRKPHGNSNPRRGDILRGIIRDLTGR